MNSATGHKRVCICWGAALLIPCFGLVLFVSCSGSSDDTGADIALRVERADGELGEVRGPARAVEDFQSRAASMREIVVKANYCYELLKNTSDALDRQVAQKCIRDIRSYSENILQECASARNADSGITDTTADQILAGYESYAQEMLRIVEGL